MLAAGPFEYLIARGGDQFIERIENEARRNPAFKHFLAGA
jgi:hypothetical protein